MLRWSYVGTLPPSDLLSCHSKRADKKKHLQPKNCLVRGGKFTKRVHRESSSDADEEQVIQDEDIEPLQEVQALWRTTEEQAKLSG